MIEQNQYFIKSLFNGNIKNFVILFCSSSILIFSILSIVGGLGVIIFAALLLLFTLPIVIFFEKLSKIKGLVLGYVFAVNFKSFFLLTKLLVISGNKKNALIINDAAGYIASAFNPNLLELALNYGTDIGYVIFLKFLAQIFNISSLDIPIVFVLPNIFMSSLIVIFSVYLLRQLLPKLNTAIIFWIAALDPMIANYSTVALKDTLVATFVSVSFVVFFTKRKFISQVFLTALSFIGSFILRYRSFPIIVGIIGIRILFGNQISKTTKLVYTTVSSLALILILFFGLVSNLNFLNRGKSILDTEKAHTEKLAIKGKADIKSTGRLGFLINSIPSLPLRVSARSLMSYLAPIPPVQFYQFDWGNGIDSRQNRIFRDLGGIYWYIMMPLSLLGIYSFVKRKEYFIPLSLFIVILAMGLGGWVDARMRLMAIIPIYILITKGISEWKFVNLFSICFYSALLLSWLSYEMLF